jgi:post-segregation antitoxin (ccd killing protein)
MGSGPYAEGWRRENPDALGSRTVETVQLPHVVVSDELLQRARERFYALWPVKDSLDAAVDAAVNAVAGDLWQAGFDAAVNPPSKPLPEGQVWAWIGDHWEPRGTGLKFD